MSSSQRHESEEHMPTVMIALNILFAVGVLVAIVGHLLHAVFTQHRDHGVVASGPPLRRRIWSRGGRPHAGPVRPWIARPGQVWPAA
jgi:hypothetical protein